MSVHKWTAPKEQGIILEAMVLNGTAFTFSCPSSVASHDIVVDTLGSIHTALSDSDMLKSDSLEITMLAKEMAYPIHFLGKSLAKICLFPQA